VWPLTILAVATLVLLTASHLHTNRSWTQAIRQISSEHADAMREMRMTVQMMAFGPPQSQSPTTPAATTPTPSDQTRPYDGTWGPLPQDVTAAQFREDRESADAASRMASLRYENEVLDSQLQRLLSEAQAGGIDVSSVLSAPVRARTNGQVTEPTLPLWEGVSPPDEMEP
jgi:hypothetical protein